MLSNSLLSALRSLPLTQQQRENKSNSSSSQCRERAREQTGLSADTKAKPKALKLCVCVAVFHCTYARVCVCVRKAQRSTPSYLSNKKTSLTQSLSLPTLFQPLSQSNDSSARTSTTTVSLCMCACVCMQGAKIHPELPEPHIHKQQEFIQSLSLSLCLRSLTQTVALAHFVTHTVKTTQARTRARSAYVDDDCDSPSLVLCVLWPRRALSHNVGLSLNSLPEECA